MCVHEERAAASIQYVFFHVRCAVHLTRGGTFDNYAILPYKRKTFNRIKMRIHTVWSLIHSTKNKRPFSFDWIHADWIKLRIKSISFVPYGFFNVRRPVADGHSVIKKQSRLCTSGECNSMRKFIKIELNRKMHLNSNTWISLVTPRRTSTAITNKWTTHTCTPQILCFGSFTKERCHRSSPDSYGIFAHKSLTSWNESKYTWAKSIFVVVVAGCCVHMRLRLASCSRD